MTKPDLHFNVDREPDDLERLLAKPPITGKRIFADGVMDPFRHPELEAALEDYHDDLKKWLEGKPGAAGKAKFMLAYAFGKAGHPLRAMPPSKQLIDAIWTRTFRLLNPAYVKACAAHEAIVRRSRLPASLPPVLISRTIHGSRVLLENAEVITRKIVAEFNRVLPNGGTTQFEDYAKGAEDAAISAADRYDPTKASRFGHLSLI